jgi:hypothetical protein
LRVKNLEGTHEPRVRAVEPASPSGSPLQLEMVNRISGGLAPAGIEAKIPRAATSRVPLRNAGPEREAAQKRGIGYRTRGGRKRRSAAAAAGGDGLNQKGYGVGMITGMVRERGIRVLSRGLEREARLTKVQKAICRDCTHL